MELQSLAEQITRTLSSDRVELAHLHQTLKSARDRIPVLDGELGARVKAAVMLTDFMARASDPVPQSDLMVVAELLDPSVAFPQANEEDATPQQETTGLRLMADMLLGDILIQMGVLSRSKLEDGLRLQLKTREPLGRCLVQLGAINSGQLEEALEVQLRMRGGADAETGSSSSNGGSGGGLTLKEDRGQYYQSVADCLLGEIMVRLGRISEEQLERALQVQRATGMRVGEALVDIGATNWTQIQRALEIQAQRRSR